MKKNTLIKSAIVVAVAAATTATTIADTKLYGRFRAGVVCSDAGDDTACSLQNGSSRFGIKAKHAINDGLTAFGRYEFGVNLDEGHLSNGEQTNRLAYVGLKGGFGEFSVGSRWTPMYNYVTSPVDPYQMIGDSAGVYQQTTFRKADSVNYKNKFGAASVHLMMLMDEDADSDFSDEIQLGVGFKAGSVNLGLAYRDNDADTQIGVSAGTKFGPIGVAASFITSDEAEVDSLSLRGSYSLGGGKAINANFGTSNAGDADPSNIVVEYSHSLSKNYRWFAAVNSADADVDGSDNVLTYGAGMRLEF